MGSKGVWRVIAAVKDAQQIWVIISGGLVLVRGNDPINIDGKLPISHNMLLCILA